MEVAALSVPSPTPAATPRRRCLLCRADFACSVVDEEACAGGRSDIERLSAVVDATIVLTAGGPPWWGSKLLCPDCDLALDEISRALKNRLAIRRCFIKNVAMLHACGVVAPPALEEPAGHSPTAFGADVGGAEREAAGGRRACGCECPLTGRAGAAATATADERVAATCHRRRSSPADRDGDGELRSREESRGRRHYSPCTAKLLQPGGERSGGCSSPPKAATAAGLPPSACTAVQKQGHINVPPPDDCQGHLDNLKDGESSENYSETPGCCNGGTADRCPSNKRKSTDDDCVQVEAGPQPGSRKLSRLLQTLSCAAAAAAAGGLAASPPASVVSASAVSAVQPPPLVERGNLASAATDANADGDVSASSALRRLSMVLGVGRASSSQASMPPSNDKALSSMNPPEPFVIAQTPEATTASSTKHPRWSPAVEPAIASTLAGVNQKVSARQQTLCTDSKVGADNGSRQASVTALHSGQTALEADATATMAYRAESQRQQMLRLRASDPDTSEHCQASSHSAGQASNGPAQQQQHMVLSSFLASLALPRPQLQQQVQLAASSTPMAVAADRRMHGLNAQSPLTGSHNKTGYQNPPVSSCAGATGLHQHLPTAFAVASQPPAGGGLSQLYSPLLAPSSAALPISATVSCSLPPSSIYACTSQASVERAYCRRSASDAAPPGLASNFGRSTSDSEEHVPKQHQLDASLVKSGVPAACSSQLLLPLASSAAATAVDAPVACLPSQLQLQIRHIATTSVSASAELQSISKSPPTFTQAAAATAAVDSAAAAAQGCADQVPAHGKECSAIRHGPWKLPDRGSAMTTLWKLLQQPAHPGQDQSQPSSAIGAPVSNNPVVQHVQDRDTTTCKTPTSDSTQLGSRTALPAAAAGGICDAAAAAPLSFLVRSAAARALVESPLSAVRSNSSSTTGTCRRSPSSGCGESSRGGSGHTVGATMPLLAGMFEKLCEPPSSLPPPRSSMNPAAAAAASAAAAAAAPVARRSTQPSPSAEQPQRLDVVNPTSRMPQEAFPHPLKRLRRYSLGHRYQRSPSNGGLGHTSFSNDPCRRRLIRTAAVQRLSPNMFGSSSVIGKVECTGDEAYTCADEHGNDDFILGESEHLSYGMQSRHSLPAADASASGTSAVDLSSEAFFRPARLELKSEPVDV